jgi:hypothetical protein
LRFLASRKNLSARRSQQPGFVEVFNQSTQALVGGWQQVRLVPIEVLEVRVPVLSLLPEIKPQPGYSASSHTYSDG